MADDPPVSFFLTAGAAIPDSGPPHVAPTAAAATSPTVAVTATSSVSDGSALAGVARPVYWTWVPASHPQDQSRDRPLATVEAVAGWAILAGWFWRGRRRMLRRLRRKQLPRPLTS